MNIRLEKERNLVLHLTILNTALTFLITMLKVTRFIIGSIYNLWSIFFSLDVETVRQCDIQLSHPSGLQNKRESTNYQHTEVDIMHIATALNSLK